MEAITAADIAKLVGGRLEGKSDVRIRGISTLRDAGPEEASFLANPKYRRELQTTTAGVVLLDEQVAAPEHLNVIRCRDPYLAFALVQRHFHPQPESAGRRHPSAIIDPTARLAEDVDVGAQAVIEAGVSIGPGTIIEPGCIIGRDVCIGSRCHLMARAVVAYGCVLADRVILQPGAVIGADGFGYAWSGKEHLKIPQVGRVILEDDVEVGANACIDRGALGDTVIRRGAKLDNLLQIGHNVVIGEHTVMAGLTAVAGSTTIGRGCQVGGHSAFAGHIHVGDGCRIAGKSGVISDLEAGGTYAGTPAMPHKLWLRIMAAMRRLPELIRQQG